MIFKYTKHLLLALSLISISPTHTTPTRQEIIDELALVRENAPQLQWDMQCKPFERYYQDRMDEAKILDTLRYSEYFMSTYITFKLTAFLVRSGMGDMFLLTPNNAPKTYEFVSEIAEKIGLEETPWIYLVSDAQLFNAFASGFSHSTAIIGLGERLIQETTDSQALEFLIAHELAHIKSRHMAKKMAIALPLGLAAIAYDIYVNRQTYLAEDGTTLWFPRARTLEELSISLGLKITTGLLFAWQSRTHEREADILAAHAVGTQGGIELFNLFKHKEAQARALQLQAEEAQAVENPPTRLSNIAKTIQGWLEAASIVYRTHPTDDQRIEYLNELQKQQDTKAAVKPAQA